MFLFRKPDEGQTQQQSENFLYLWIVEINSIKTHYYVSA